MRTILISRGVGYARVMCVQCASTGAITATAAATGARIWLAAYAPLWLTPGRRTALSAVVVTGGVVAAGLLAG